jgi:hypothetical protein
MYGKGQRMPYAEDRAKRIGPETQVCNLAQEFKAVLLRLKRVFFGITIS